MMSMDTCSLLQKGLGTKLVTSGPSHLVLIRQLRTLINRTSNGFISSPCRTQQSRKAPSQSRNRGSGHIKLMVGGAYI